MPTKPTTIELDMNDLEDALRRAESALSEKDYALFKAVCESYAYLSDLVGDKSTTISRLRKILFGAKTEKTAAVVGKREATAVPPSGADTPAASLAEGDLEVAAKDDAEPSGKGHGRNGADAYTGAEKIEVPHESLTPGDPCPKCETGTVYETARPGVLVRFTGQAPVQAKVYYLQKLRCNLCGEVFTAQPPADAGSPRYDATVGSMIALLKYGTGMPFHRDERLQKSLGVPLPASTQWGNNLCERILKKAILHRKNALFYKTCRGAHVGDVLMSLIHTCELGGINPFNYLYELERHAGELSANPQNWMPWNYRETLAATTTPAPSR